MELNDEMLKKLMEEVVNQKEINITDIPCIDLYMDQVTTFFDDRLNYLKRDDEDKILTKTMINNYTKAKILMPAKNKKYSKNHMILLILIYQLKQVLSMGDINLLLHPMIKELENDRERGEALEKLYNLSLDIKELEEKSFEKEFQEKLELIKNKSFDGDKDEGYLQALLTILTLVNGANLQKRMAEKIIDNLLKSMYQKS